METVIQTEHLVKKYGKARGITDVSLTVNAGEIYGFMGPNGAGKSTTIRSLLGLIQITGGTAQIFGKDCTREKADILKKIGYMPSETVFYKGMKVKDVIALSAKLRGKDCRKQADILCERLRLDVDRKVEQLSLGNRKKVGIVCAMQHEPELCIFDEPTSGLDPLIQKVFFDLILERNKEGATFFLSSHVLSEVKKYCTRAAIIRDGKVIAEDSVENLIAGSARKVTVSGIADLPEKLQKRVKKVTKDGEQIHFLYQGEPKMLLDILHTQPLTDLLIEEPDMEEIFLHYYQ